MTRIRFLELALVGILAAVPSCGCSGSDDDADDDAPWPGARDDRTQAQAFPDWTFSMVIWPFDILLPDTTDAEIDERLDIAVENGADTVIFYMESEHMYGTFVDDAGFSVMLTRIEALTAAAQALGLHTISYVNGLEVMTRGAFDENCESTGVPTMATEHPDWLQRDLSGEPIVYGCQDQDWLEPDWEDAWISPFSGYREFFQQRLAAIGSAGVDAVYIDATFLPGYTPEEQDFRYASTDPAFAAAFTAATGFDVPQKADLDGEAFRAFLDFRHTALAEYLGSLATAAWDAGLVPFWESSTNDTPECTALGNDTAVTGRAGLGFSPEVEPEGDWVAAFRMAKAARELNQERPQIYLNWPEDEADSTLFFANAIAHSNNYYPTADAPIPDGALAFLEEISGLLRRRVAYAGDVALLYSVRNQDLSFEDSAYFDAYSEAFAQLAARHVPFRIQSLEYLGADGLGAATTVVLPGIRSISDAEAERLDAVSVARFGDDVGTLDEVGDERDEPLGFVDEIEFDDIEARLPFTLEAPENTLIEFYGDREGERAMSLFAVSPEPEGVMTLTAAADTALAVVVHRLGAAPETLDADEEIEVEIDSPFMVIDVREAGL
jgi:hypothetical protein